MSTTGNKKDYQVLALIPARGGSQRVKNKNILPLDGKPLIAYTIEAAKASKLVDRVIVSTDSEEIAEVARKYGAEVPFLRPAELATPESTEYEFHKHALDWLQENENYEPDILVNLYPTTPFRKPDSIDAAVQILIDNSDVDSVRSIRKVSEHPYKMWKKDGELVKPYVESKDSGAHTAAYHLLETVYIQNASIYCTRPFVVRELKRTIGDRVRALEMSEEESVDINSPIDFKFAEFMIGEMRLGESR